jgi:U3 small nucleolar RNA-associated protein 13
MASKVQVKTTFEVAGTIEPIYTGGSISGDATGRYLATSVDEDVFIVDIETGKPLARIEGDGEPLTSIALSPNASHVVICSRSLSLRIFRLSKSEIQDQLETELVKTLKPHATPVVTSAIDSTSTLLATGGADGIVKIWDIKGGFVTHTLHGHGGVVSALHFFETRVAGMQRKGKRKSRTDEDHEMQDAMANVMVLASGGEDGKIRIWNLNTSKTITILDSHVSVVRSLDFSSQQDTLLSVSRDKTIILWSTNTWKATKVIPALEVLEAGGFLLEGQYCYGGGENGVFRVWATVSGQEITERQVAGSENDAIVALFPFSSADGVTSVHQDQTLKIHSQSSLRGLPPDSTLPALPIIKRISGNHDEIIDMACVGPDRSMLALATNTESVRIVSTVNESETTFGADVALLEGHEEIIICLDVDWSGHWLATGAKDNSARLWRLDPVNSSYTCFATFVGHAESLGAIALPRIAPTGAAAKDPLNYPPTFLLTGSQDKTVKRWDTSKLAVSKANDGPLTAAKALYTRVAHEKDINAIDVSPIAPLFASASQDRTIKIWSLDDGSVAGILRGHKRGVWSIRFAPANTAPIILAEGGSSSSRGLIVSGSGDRTVKVWSLSTYTCLLTFEGHSNSVLKVIWLAPLQSTSDDKSPQSHPIIASASSDTLIKLWSAHDTSTADLESDHLLTTLSAHTDRIWALTSSPAYPLISGAADATITFWTDATSQTLSTLTAAASARIEQDQDLQNYILAKNYREVITLALQLNHPGRLLRLFEDILALPAAEKESGSITGVATVDDVLASLSREQLYMLLLRVRDWNTNARTAPVAQKVLSCLLRKYPASTYTNMAKDRNLRGVKDLLRALEVYTERHFKRMEELVDESYLLEYTLRSMDEISGVDVNGHAEIEESNGDVLMT